MANIIRYSVDTAFTSDSTLATGLNSLATAGTAAGTVITNGTNLDILGDLSIQLGSVNPSAPTYLEVHVLPLLGDGTTYADLVSAGPTMVGTAVTTTGSSAKNIILSGLIIPPGSFKFGIVNQTGVTLAASGNAVYYRLYNYNTNG